MCGIYGIINDKKVPFDFATFCTLGIANDRRGGDSCGIFIDGKVEYGIGNTARFEDFFWDSKLLLNTTTARIAIGHDRKASVGGVSLEKAHPILIKNKNKLEFVLIHNGTIYNYEELAAKYIPKIKIDGYSDSQVLALLLYHSGFKCLNEYIGGAAFVAVDYRDKTPKVYIFKGESRKTEYVKKAEEERPLYIGKGNDDSVVFSSIPSYLFACTEEIKTVPANKVCLISNGVLCLHETIDRSKCTQSQAVKVRTVTTSKNVDYTYSYAKYLIFDRTSYRYKVEGKYPHGLLKLTNYGRVLEDSVDPIYSCEFGYFFDGILMNDAPEYNFVCDMFKHSPEKDLHKFTQKNEHLIRFLSYLPVYFKNNVLVEAVSCTDCEEYSGHVELPWVWGSTSFISGKEVANLTKTTGYPAKKKPRNINLPEIWRNIQQLMK